jgi:hypothetical protein
MLFRGEKDYNKLLYLKIGLEDAEEFRRTIDNLSTDLYICSINNLYIATKQESILIGLLP